MSFLGKLIVVCTLLTTLIGCGEEKNKRVIVVPKGISIPQLTILKAKIDTEKEVSEINKIYLSLESLGGVSVNNCIVNTRIKLKFEHSRIKTRLENIECHIGSGVSKVRIEGYVIDAEEGLVDIPFYCKNTNKCYPKVEDINLILTSEVDLSGFMFESASNDEKEKIGFDTMAD
jgi:hypothetical protein